MFFHNIIFTKIFKGINSFDYIEQIGSVNKDYTEQILNEVFAENKMVLSVINSK